ncbi:hypothetical protein ACVWWN_002646 [Mycobacterium sp. URHB0021]
MAGWRSTTRRTSISPSQLAVAAGQSVLTNVSLRIIEQNLTTGSPELVGGQLNPGTGRISGNIFISVRAYLPGKDNSARNLPQLVPATLADFGLTGVIQ